MQSSTVLFPAHLFPITLPVNSRPPQYLQTLNSVSFAQPDTCALPGLQSQRLRPQCASEQNAAITMELTSLVFLIQGSRFCCVCRTVSESTFSHVLSSFIAVYGSRARPLPVTVSSQDQESSLCHEYFMNLTNNKAKKGEQIVPIFTNVLDPGIAS